MSSAISKHTKEQFSALLAQLPIQIVAFPLFCLVAVVTPENRGVPSFFKLSMEIPTESHFALLHMLLLLLPFKQAISSVCPPLPLFSLHYHVYRDIKCQIVTFPLYYLSMHLLYYVLLNIISFTCASNLKSLHASDSEITLWAFCWLSCHLVITPAAWPTI